MTSERILLTPASSVFLHARFTLVCGAFVAVLLLVIVRYRNSPWRKLPPGPRGLPILGHVLDMRGQYWLKFADWNRAYGDVFSLNAFGNPILVINSLKAATDLLERRAAIYSDRPRLIAGGEVMCGGQVFALQNSGPHWRRIRKATHEALNDKGVWERMEHDKVNEAITLALGLLNQPIHYRDHIHRTSASFILSATYGTPLITSKDDALVKVSDEWIERFARENALGAHLVDTFPLLEYVPRRFAKWRRQMEAFFERDTRRFAGLLKGVQTDMDAGVERPSFASVVLQSDETRSNLSPLEKAWTVGFMYAAGTDTMSTTLEWWMIAMIVHPDAQARAQAEIDTVVGRGRIPTAADLPNLPYVRATVRETLRWRPVSPTGLPHNTSEDDWYEGMFIPKGTTVIPNVWAMNREPYGADADNFEPARHLDAQGEMAAAPADTREEGHVTYGFGRRICVGRQLANAALTMHAAMTLWACSLGHAKDENGRDIPVDVDEVCVAGLAVHPRPFQFNIVPRFSDATHTLIEERDMRAH
ncbi:cytochrome P450 [Auriscalpium vulgare]|uniref:Cytochrome P450 n=1 Tax=Auriscalpium vulgare TaxID=40419 RepID=A0ACB8RTY1_9AGAM|nr:cytochrome P450 [Auriscalpium vulgare]